MIINLERLVRGYWYDTYIRNCEKNSISFSFNNPEYLRWWFDLRRKDVEEEIEAARARFEELGGKTLDEVKEIASRYEFPEFPEIGPPRNEKSLIREPQPLDKASARRDLEATTFNCCGWCRYRGRGGIISIYGYHIVANCSLIPEILDNGSRASECGCKKLRFNTPCVIVNGNEDLWTTCKEWMCFELVKLEAEKAILDVYSRYLTAE